jgi:serine/threonine protein kinase
MQNSNSSSTSQIVAPESTSLKKLEENYAVILEQYGAEYHKVNYYWQVGATQKLQGWILHLSVITPQMVDLLHMLVPVLLKQKTVFKLAIDKTIARNILDGIMGCEQLGKVISIYPEDEDDALVLAKQLVKLTSTFRGPAIPTDIHLGGVVYTRYGSINPIIRQATSGQMEKYIYASNGELVKDSYHIPFLLPTGVVWPFKELTVCEVPRLSKNLHHIYKPMTILKQDVRGNVIKALYLKGFLRVGTCVIKAGKKNMLADDLGRDMKDRLHWQKILHQELDNYVRLPKILDYFEENGTFYLVMEFIKGKSLNDRLVEIHRNQKSWFQLSSSEQSIILQWLLNIVAAIDLLHKKGFVHRDIAPGNFLIDERGELVLIDVELTYDLKKNKKELPYELGTPGFMSPEQEAVSIPTVKDDIYGLGALMINCFTCLSALRFNVNNPSDLFRNLLYFIRNSEIVELIGTCLSLQPLKRPHICEIQSSLEHFKTDQEIKTPYQQIPPPATPRLSESLQITIRDALHGLCKKPMPFYDGIWQSKTIKNDRHTVNTNKEFSPYVGIHTGMTGVLYLLARAHKMGYELEPNKTGYKECWKYIYREHLNNLENLNPGLFNGTAGIALALVEGLEAGLLEDSELIRKYIEKCLENPSEQLNLADGCAGQGIALLQCAPWMNSDISKKLLKNLALQLISRQKKDGSWNNSSLTSSKTYNIPVSWSQGITGILYFLMASQIHYENQQVREAVNKSLTYLLKRSHDLKGLFIPSVYKKLLENQPEVGDERTGVILCYIKAYHFLQDPYFKELAERALYLYPDFVVNSNFSQEGGLAALGEVYLEAWRIFKNEEWQKRALQIASVFLHTSYHLKGESCYWLMDETGKPVADLLSGNSGIIHFLLRCSDPEKLNHILLK